MPPTSSAPKLTLPLTPSDADRRWINQRFVLIGQPGVGKSTLWANGQRTLFLDTEGNIGHLKVMRLASRSMDEMRAIYVALYAARGDAFPYDTIVVDTVDKFVDAAETEVIAWGQEKFKRSQIEHIGDIPEGGGYSKLGKSVMSMLDALDSLPAAIVVITHPKAVKVKPADAVEYDKESIAVFPSIANRILGWGHHNLHIQARWTGQELKRIVRTQPERGIEAKSHGGLVPDRWSWETRDLRKEYDYLRGLFE